MPSLQPFTTLCQTLAGSRAAGWIDLHLHTTHSDGTYTPAQVVELGKRSGLAALAITDHDTLGGVDAARSAAGSALQILAGVEVTAKARAHAAEMLRQARAGK